MSLKDEQANLGGGASWNRTLDLVRPSHMGFLPIQSINFRRGRKIVSLFVSIYFAMQIFRQPRFVGMRNGGLGLAGGFAGFFLGDFFTISKGGLDL